MPSFHFYRWNLFKVTKSFPWPVLSVKNLPKFSATCDVRYWVNQVRRCAAWLTDVEKSRLELETINK